MERCLLTWGDGNTVCLDLNHKSYLWLRDERKENMSVVAVVGGE